MQERIYLGLLLQGLEAMISETAWQQAQGWEKLDPQAWELEQQAKGSHLEPQTRNKTEGTRSQVRP